MKKNYIICYSGGHSSAICAIECVRKFGKKNVVLLNHDISGKVGGLLVEDQDIKRFKQEVADYLDLPITYCNSPKYTTPLEVINDLGVIHGGNTHAALCTYYLKTLPFYEWLAKNYPVEKNDKLTNPNCVLVYGFDKSEPTRMHRKIGMALKQGYDTTFPLFWQSSERTIQNTEEIGIKRPKTYELFKHANCTGCLKAGKLHWLLVYIFYPTIFNEYAKAEKQISVSILKMNYLDEFREEFEIIKNTANIDFNEHINGTSFFAKIKKILNGQISFDSLPCDCGV